MLNADDATMSAAVDDEESNLGPARSETMIGFIFFEIAWPPKTSCRFTDTGGMTIQARVNSAVQMFEAL